MGSPTAPQSLSVHLLHRLLKSVSVWKGREGLLRIVFLEPDQSVVYPSDHCVCVSVCECCARGCECVCGCVYLRVCMGVRGRERGRERNLGLKLDSFFLWDSLLVELCIESCDQCHEVQSNQ